ncbi:hypothetical protein [Arthrobacter sp. U41]|uniref:hypothetical protein n=1 Tax=Arthrobacter sp. U41 TaxID=1849032 RepID=UPI00085942CA|nr:hypothetical protein [Arthrobacter sp. U41]AOT04414.1 hypothetical protein ASPU41_14895 [Arthrobacter sp. U41]
MAASPTAPAHIDRFLAEATIEGMDDATSLGKDQLYGLYISWCLLHDAAPRPVSGFWAALKSHRISPGRTGLRMAGPAATDYILATYPVLN